MSAAYVDNNLLGVLHGVNFWTSIGADALTGISKLLERGISRVGSYTRASGDVSEYWRYVPADRAPIGSQALRGLLSAGQIARGLTVIKWVGRASTVLTIGVSGYEQWNSDAGLPTGERVTRAAVVGGSTGAGALAGAEAGATFGGWAGLACGPLAEICVPVGFGLGGIGGGLVGGLAGTWFGREVIGAF